MAVIGFSEYITQNIVLLAWLNYWAWSWFNINENNGGNVFGGYHADDDFKDVGDFFVNDVAFILYNH